MITLPPSRVNGAGDHSLGINDLVAEEAKLQLATAGADAQPLFSQAEREQILFRRFNPYAYLTAATLSAALDEYEAGILNTAARIWARIAKSDPVLNTVKPKREEAVSLRGISTRAKDDSPLAKDQAMALDSFYRNTRCTHATKRYVSGGSALLLEQMMESVAFEIAAHHIIFKPDAANPVTLPSGKEVPALSATFEYVPLEFFEARTGELRFLGVNNFYNGDPLEKYGQWLITTGPGLMFSASILHYFSRLARHDMVNFSEKFGTPGTLVHTTAQQNSVEGKAALELANKLASNYRGVLYGAAENKAEYLWPSGGASGEALPMHVLTSDIKQEMISMWMGADLSTQSRGRGVTGASVQGEDQEKKERRDCRRISDTLQAQIDPLVLRWFFGTNTPILAEAFIDYPTKEDAAQLIQSAQFVVNGGGKVPVRQIAERLDVPLADDKAGEQVLKPEPTMQLGAGGGGIGGAGDSDAVNARTGADADLERFLGPLRDDYLLAFANDLQPLRTAMEAVMQENDGIAFNTKVAWLRGQLPSLLKEVNQSPKSADALAAILRASFTRGFEQAAQSRSTAELAATAH